MQSYIIYILALIAILLSACIARKSKKKVYVWVIIFILTFIAGFRGYTVGKDTKSYIQIFHQLRTNAWRLAYGEIGFKFLSCTFLRIIDDYTVLLVFYAFMTNMLIVIRLWDYRNVASFPWMIVCYYISFYFMTMNIMRQFFAVSILFYSTKYIDQRKYVKFLLSVVIATLFHTASLIGFVFIAFDIFQWRHLNQKQKYFIGFGVVVSPALLYFIFLNIEKYFHYFETTDGPEIGLMLIVKLMIYALGWLLLYKRDQITCGKALVDERNVYRSRCVKFYYFIGIILTGLGYFFNFMDRIGLPFYLFECIYFGMVVKVPKEKQIFKIVLSLLFAYVFIIGLINNGQGVLPYYFVWQSI